MPLVTSHVVDTYSMPLHAIMPRKRISAMECNPRDGGNNYGKGPKCRTGLMGRLSEKSHEELLVLLEQLVQRQPDIEPLIELLIELPPVTTTQQKSRPGRGRERTLDPATIRS